MLMVNISRGRAAWLAGTAANFGDVTVYGSVKPMSTFGMWPELSAKLRG